MNTEHEDTSNSELPGNLSWHEHSVSGGIISLECPGCKEKHSLQVALFASESPNLTEGLTRTDEELLWGRAIVGMFWTFVIAVIIGLAITFAVGGTSIWIALVSAAIYMGLKPVLSAKFMAELPVWISECKSCGSRAFIASDGETIALGETNGS